MFATRLMLRIAWLLLVRSRCIGCSRLWPHWSWSVLLVRRVNYALRLRRRCMTICSNKSILLLNRRHSGWWRRRYLNIVHSSKKINNIIEPPTPTRSSSCRTLRLLQLLPPQLSLLIAIWDLIQVVIFYLLAIRVSTPTCSDSRDDSGVLIKESLLAPLYEKLRSRWIWNLATTCSSPARSLWPYA